MHENLKTQPDKVFMYFQKVYNYMTNTAKWSELTEKQKISKGFEWTISKLWIVSKTPITVDDYYQHLERCPELYNETAGVNDQMFKPMKNWKKTYEDPLIYGAHPITPYDLKLLLHVIGIRMIHFVDN